jgi:putative ABC transport system permease protein
MGTLWKIALRNTLRHGRRTIITAAVMTIGIACFIFFDSMLSGMDRITIDNMEAYSASAVKLRTSAYVEDIEMTPLDKGIPDPERALAAIGEAGYAAAPRLRFVAKLSNYEDEIPVIADGVDPAADARVFSLASSIVEGAWLAPGAAKAVVMGAALAKELGLGVGDGLVVSARTLDEATNADEYLIVGLARTPSPEINRAGLFMSLETARELLAAPGLATEIDVALPRAPSLDAELAASEGAATRLRALLPALRADSLGDQAKDYLAMRNMKAKFSYIMIFVVLLIAAVGIANTILMSVYARVREIGVLRAYGMTGRDIKRLFTLEGLAVGLLGSTLGVLLGAGIDLYLIKYGIDLDRWMQNMATAAVPISGLLRGAWNPGTMAVGFVFGLAVSLVSARIPARMAARLEPTAALRFA